MWILEARGGGAASVERGAVPGRSGGRGVRLLLPGGSLRPPVTNNRVYGEAQLALGLRGRQEALGGLGEAGGQDRVRRPDSEAGRL